MVESAQEGLNQSYWVVARKIPETEARKSLFKELRKALPDEFNASVFQLVIKNENLVVILGKSPLNDLTEVNKLLSTGVDAQLDEQILEDLKEIRVRRLKWETQRTKKPEDSFHRRPSATVLVQPPITPRDLFYFDEIVYDE